MNNLEQELITIINNLFLFKELAVSTEKALTIASSAYDNTKSHFILGKSDVNSLSLTLNRQRDVQLNYKNSIENY